MNTLVKSHYSPSNQVFAEVLWITEEKPSWETLQALCPSFPRGWFELCCLEVADRIEFTKEYWLKTLPFVPRAHPGFLSFFRHLDDVGVFLLRNKQQDFWQVEFVYSLRSEACFFRGGLFLSGDEVGALNQQFEHILPKDYLAFFRIHNGFARHNDIGLIRAEQVKSCQEKVFHDLGDKSQCFSSSLLYDRTSLIPFYECFGLHSFQCFFKEWYPTSEIGNVYFSGIDYTISNTAKREEDLAFESFSEWLAFYLEGRET